jgi:hypothetical protein
VVGALVLVAAATARAGAPQVQFSADGPWMRIMANGTYEWQGRRYGAVVHRDGTFEIWPRRDAGADEHVEVGAYPDEKQWFLDETLDMRGELAAKARAEWRSAAIGHLPAHLASVWRNRRWSLAERRHILFLLWDECAEPDDAELGGAGAHARQVIDQFIRTYLPRGSVHAFSTEELAQLNAQRAYGPRFDPYHSPYQIDRR